MNKAETKIIEIGQKSGGIIRKSVCREICKSKAYYKRILQKMKKEEKAESVFGYGEGILSINRGLRITKNRQILMRRIGISQTIWNAELAGLCELEKLSQKADGYIMIQRIKTEQERGSRARAVYVKNEKVYMVYNAMGYNIKFNKKIENRSRMRILSRLIKEQLIKEIYAIIYVDDYKLCNKFLANQGNNQIEPNLITPDLPFAQSYIILNGEAGIESMEYIFKKPKQQIKALKEKYGEISGIGVGDGICSHGTIYDMTGMELYKLKQLTEKLESKVVLCTKTQHEYLKTLNIPDTTYEIIDQ